MPVREEDERQQPQGHGGGGPPKRNEKVLSVILKVIIMSVITTLFFLFLGVAAIVLLIATVVLHRHNNPSNFSSGLSVHELKRLPQFRYPRRTTRGGEADRDCAICLEGIRQGQWCRKLGGCGHVLHRKCVDSWLVKVPACPICRTRVHLDVDRQFWGFDWRNEFNVW